jgi:hypothetical protein
MLGAGFCLRTTAQAKVPCLFHIRQIYPQMSLVAHTQGCICYGCGGGEDSSHRTSFSVPGVGGTEKSRTVGAEDRLIHSGVIVCSTKVCG